VKTILETINKHFNRKKHINLAELSQKAALPLEITIYIVKSLNKLSNSTKTPESAIMVQKKPQFTSKRKASRSKIEKEQDGTENEGPLIQRNQSYKKPKK